MSTYWHAFYAVLGLVLTLLLRSDNRQYGVDAFSPHGARHSNSAHGPVLGYLCDPRKSSMFRPSTVLFSANSKNKMSRPEKKALERKRKHMKENSTTNVNTISSATSINESKKFILHSNNISELNSNSSADDVIRAIKRYEVQNKIQSICSKMFLSFFISQPML
jgi:hypothetical protein